MKTTVVIEKVVHGGLGLARTEKGVLFVEDVLPGETAHVSVIGIIGGQRLAKPLEIENPSAHRRKAPCPYYGNCGGCDLMHGTYEAQCAIKKEIFIECLKRLGKIDGLPEIELFSAREFGYRHRAQFKIDIGQGAVGFYKRKSREVVAISSCPLLGPELNELLAKSPVWAPLTGALTTQIKCLAGRGGVIASSPVLHSFTSAKTAMLAGNFSFEVSGDCFFQGNTFLCEPLGAWVAGATKGQRCLDLYGGVGFFSAFVHAQFTSGVLIDNAREQAALAAKNFAENGIANFSAVAADAEDYLHGKEMKKNPADCVIVDPPRAGLSEPVRRAILKLRPNRIVYMSCDPATQARDAGFFVSKGKYEIQRLALFDLYPNTHHMETAMLLCAQ